MQLRWYQDEAVFSLFDYFEHNSGNPVIALPTGTGKSLVIGDFIRRVFQWPRQRIMMLTHVKELIEQNAEKLQAIWPTAPLGIYSAGLRQRDIMLPIVFGGIQSVSKSPEIFGHRDLILIDECHLVAPSGETMYQKTIGELRKINPYLKCIGLSATAYRLKQGMITDGGIFTDICYDMTTFENFNRLVAEGYLAPIIPKRTDVEIDVSNVGISNSSCDFKGEELETAAEKVTFECCKEIVRVAFDRRCWMAFASGIGHAEHIASTLNSFGIQAAAVHSDLTDEENKTRIRDFKYGDIRCLVNMNKLTTGFDHPPIDYIAMLRPTISPGLNVQMWGRGTRPSPSTGKVNCLGSDFAGNTRRLGPINDPRIPGKPSRAGGDMPIKICEQCGAYNHPKVLICVGCGAEFEFANKLLKTASDAPIMRSDQNEIVYHDVKKVIYNRHEKRNKEGVLLKPPSMKVSYYCGMQRFSHWVCIEHGGIAGKRARDWWRQHHESEPPQTTEQALQLCSQLRVPARIRVWMNKDYPEVLGYEY